MTETNSSPPDTNTPPTVEGAGQPVVAVQSIMVAEQTQELATATTFATPDATTQRQGQANEVRPDYSPYRTDQGSVIYELMMVQNIYQKCSRNF